MPDVQTKPASHKLCVTATVALVALSIIGTYGVFSLKGRTAIPTNAADLPPSQITENESVYVYAPFYAGGAGVDLSIKQSEANATVPTFCEVSFPYKAEWSGQNLTAKTPQPDLVMLLLSKELQPGTKLGNFGPPISCNAGYIYRAEILNRDAAAEVYVRSSFYGGVVAAQGMTLKQGEPVEPYIQCDLPVTYKAMVIGGDIGKTSPGGVEVLLSKPVPDGARLGNYSPAWACNGEYVYRAEIMN